MAYNLREKAEQHHKREQNRKAAYKKITTCKKTPAKQSVQPEVVADPWAGYEVGFSSGSAFSSDF